MWGIPLIVFWGKQPYEAVIFCVRKDSRQKLEDDKRLPRRQLIIARYGIAPRSESIHHYGTPMCVHSRKPSIIEIYRKVGGYDRSNGSIIWSIRWSQMELSIVHWRYSLDHSIHSALPLDTNLCCYRMLYFSRNCDLRLWMINMFVHLQIIESHRIIGRKIQHKIKEESWIKTAVARSRSFRWYWQHLINKYEHAQRHPM